MSIITCTFTSANIQRVAAGVEKQMRFAIAMALTKTAQDAQQEIIRQLPERFTIRTGWVKQGVRYRPADKNAKNIISRVVDMDSFMALQETGGDKLKQQKAMGIPIGARSSLTSTTLLDKSKWPAALLKKQGYFLAPITGKSLAEYARNKNATRKRPWAQAVTAESVGKTGLWKRRGKKRLPIDLMYIFESEVHIKPRFGFYDTVKKVTGEKLPIRLQEAVNYAARTAR